VGADLCLAQDYFPAVFAALLIGSCGGQLLGNVFRRTIPRPLCRNRLQQPNPISSYSQHASYKGDNHNRINQRENIVTALINNYKTSERFTLEVNQQILADMEKKREPSYSEACIAKR
jgi:hypothetical protein